MVEIAVNTSQAEMLKKLLHCHDTARGMGMDKGDMEEGDNEIVWDGDDINIKLA